MEQRPHKYRGWTGTEMLPPEDLTQSPESRKWLGHIDVELLEFTGLLDKNGREIYEGDIVTAKEYPFYGDAPEIKASSGKCEELNYLGEVGIDSHGAFYELHVVSNRVRGGACGGSLEELVDGGKCEVIGNIHENPELLEGKAD